MVLTEFDEEKYLEMMREEEWAEGHATGLKEGHATGLKEGHATGLKEGYATGLMAGRRENLLSMLEELGTIPDEVLLQIKELDVDSIKHWNKLASRAGSMEEFLQNIQQ